LEEPSGRSRIVFNTKGTKEHKGKEKKTTTQKRPGDHQGRPYGPHPETDPLRPALPRPSRKKPGIIISKSKKDLEREWTGEGEEDLKEKMK
jgi:hypothetical protein